MVPVGKDSIERGSWLENEPFEDVFPIIHCYVSLPECGGPNPGSEWVNNRFPDAQMIMFFPIHLPPKLPRFVDKYSRRKNPLSIWVCTHRINV